VEDRVEEGRAVEDRVEEGRAVEDRVEEDRIYVFPGRFICTGQIYMHCSMLYCIVHITLFLLYPARN
jgi:hypothetical protein